MLLQATTELLVGQWRAAPLLRAIVETDLQRAREIMETLDEVDRMRHIDTAEGVWLDYLAGRVGLARPSIGDPTQDARFGFEGPAQSRSFDLAPFRGGTESDAVFPLPDAVFRRMIRARARLDIGDGTCQTFARAVRDIDPGALVRDNRDMTIEILTAERTLLELADSIGALPRTAGVQVLYADRGAFGFDDAGTGFDLGPFGRR